MKMRVERIPASIRIMKVEMEERIPASTHAVKVEMEEKIRASIRTAKAEMAVKITQEKTTEIIIQRAMQMLLTTQSTLQPEVLWQNMWIWESRMHLDYIL